VKSEHTASKWQLRFKEALLRSWKPIARRLRPQKSDAFQLRAVIPPSGAAFGLALFQSLGVRMRRGHQLAWFNNGAVFDAIIQEIGRARTSVHVVLYIWHRGMASERVVAALVERAQAGVACRILIDAFGSSDFEQDIAPALVDAGCEVRIFRPLPGKDKLARNHRKIVVIDGKVAITGGFGVRDDWLGDGIHDQAWRDSNLRFAGPAVAEAQQAFAENWQEAGGQLLPEEAFPPSDESGGAPAAFVTSTTSVVTRAERLMQLMIAAAGKRVWISNAYFVPSRGIAELICAKARAGVDVRILAPGKRSDSKTSFAAQHKEYRAMMKCGVRVWEYLPSMMHCKTLLVDDEMVLVGSINLDPLSLTKLEEVALIAEDRPLATELGEAFVLDCTHSKEL
jgi:cardiolipin synthase